MNEPLTYSCANDDGFSLTELMVAVSLMVIVIGAAFMAITSVNVMTDHMFARGNASRAGAIAVEKVASDIRRGWSPTAEPGIPFRTRTASSAEFYYDPAVAARRGLVKYYTSADATGGTFTLYRATAATTTNVSASTLTSSSPFTYTSPVVVATGLTSSSIFSYWRQAAGSGPGGLAAATATGPPSSVMIQIVTKAKSGQTTAIATNTTLAQMRTTYDYTSP